MLKDNKKFELMDLREGQVRPLEGTKMFQEMLKVLVSSPDDRVLLLTT